MEEPTSAAPPPGSREHPAPVTVTSALDGNRLLVTVVGELTEGARRPLVRELTDRMLAEPGLRSVGLDLRAVRFVNSAGVAVLVQLQRLGAPRGVELVLVAPTAAVVRPLQLTGLWTRFPVREDGDAG